MGKEIQNPFECVDNRFQGKPKSHAYVHSNSAWQQRKDKVLANVESISELKPASQSQVVAVQLLPRHN